VRRRIGQESWFITDNNPGSYNEKNNFRSLLFACSFEQTAEALRRGVGSNAQQEILASANQFINSLSAEQKSVALYPFDTEERYNFHYVPRERKGLAIGELGPAQRAAALVLIRSCLSEQAAKKVENIMALDNVLKVSNTAGMMIISAIRKNIISASSACRVKIRSGAGGWRDTMWLSIFLCRTKNW
jgi:hypothetical protein